MTSAQYASEFGATVTELTDAEAVTFAKFAVLHNAPSAPAMRALLRMARQLNGVRVLIDQLRAGWSAHADREWLGESFVEDLDIVRRYMDDPR